MPRALTIEQAETRCPDMVKGQEWNGAVSKYWFICERHGEYQQEFNDHQGGKRCRKCFNERTGNRCRLTIEEAESVCPDMVKGQEWKGSASRYWFICDRHGKYRQIFNNHQRQERGCRECGIEKRGRSKRRTIQEMERFCPDMVKGQEWKGVKSKYWFVCDRHGNYRQQFDNHRNGNTCRKCRRSNGEISLSVAASSLGIADYTEQKWFPSCRDKRRLIFDGASESRKILFEYQGFQHYRTGAGYFSSGKNLAGIQRRDRIKRNWARRNGWRLIVIPYRIKNIESYLRNRIPRRVEELPIAA